MVIVWLISGITDTEGIQTGIRACGNGGEDSDSHDTIP